MTKCKDCNGKGYTYSDPDHRMLECDSCHGEGMIMTDAEAAELEEEIVELMVRDNYFDEPDPDRGRDERMDR